MYTYRYAEQRKTRALIRSGVLSSHCPSFVAPGRRARDINNDNDNNMSLQLQIITV